MEHDTSKSEFQKATITGPQNAVSGEYIVVFRGDNSRDMLSITNSVSDTKKYIAIKEAMASKAQTILSTMESTADVEAVFVNTFQGFAVKNLSEANARRIEKDSRVELVIPNYIHTDVESENSTSSKSKYPDFIETPMGDYFPFNAKKIGYRNVNGSRERVFIIGSGLSYSAFNQLNVDYASARSFVSSTNWTQDSYLSGTAHALLIGAKEDGRLALGIAAGARIVPVKAKHGFVVELGDLLQAIDYIYNRANASDIFVYTPAGFYNNEPHHPILGRAFANLSRKMTGAMAPTTIYSTPNSTSQTIPYNLNLPKLWMSGLADYNFIPNESAPYGANINLWAPAEDMWVYLSPSHSVGWANIPAPAASMAAAVLYIRGNNTIGSSGTVNYYGYSAPRLKL